MPFSLPIPIFYLAATAFVLFSLIYAIIAIAIIYHLRVFSIAGRMAPHVSILIFSAVSIALWLLGLFSLLSVPR